MNSDTEGDSHQERRLAAENGAARRAGCWICGSTETRRWKTGTLEETLRPENLQITDASYGLSWPMERCERCGFVFAPAALSADLVALYTRMSDPEYVKGRDSRLRQMRWLLDIGRKYCPRARTLLDVGAAAGLLVREAQAAGLDPIGVEPSDALAVAARSVNKANVLHGVLPHADLRGRQFDLVYLVDVVEHVTDPVGLLRHAQAMLQSDGVLVVVTPDISSLAARLMGSRWWHYRPAHVCFFNHQSMSAASLNLSLTIQSAVRAKWFFEVGYLATRAEQYLPVRWLNGFASRVPPVSSVYRWTIPVNLHDSTVFVLRHTADKTPQIPG